jgi:hypothetical protein
MKARTKFMKMFDKLPYSARQDLVLNPYGDKPMSLNVVYWEVKATTPLSYKLLKAMGYNDD